MRTIWNGSISFGLVNIPIGLALATQRNDVAFRTLHRECGTPIKQKRWCPFHEREVEPEELVKGWEVAKGEFVLVEESDLESVALQRSQSIEILRFVELAEVDPVYFDRTYYLPPTAARARRRDAGHRSHGGAAPERCRCAGGKAEACRQEDESQLVGNWLSSKDTGAQERLVASPAQCWCCSAPSACSCAWKRYLSILPW